MSFIIRSTLHQAVRHVNLTLSRSFVRPSHGSATYDKGNTMYHMVYSNQSPTTSVTLNTSHWEISFTANELSALSKLNTLAYRLFDADDDGEITPEELVKILTTVGESPGDLNMYFSGMSSDTISDYRAVVDWFTFLIRHGKLSIWLH